MPSSFMLAHRGDLGTLQRTDMVGEKKLDGTRCHIVKTPTSLEMWSRNSKENSYRVNYAEVHNLPEVEHAVNQLQCKSVWLDVELCWFNKHGRSIFRGSQVRCGTKRRDAVLEKMKMYPIHAYAFDLLELNGEEYIKQPFIVRKAMLEGLMNENPNIDHLCFLPYTLEKLELWDKMLATGGEGVMAKTLMGRYEFRRSRQWLKVKNEKTAIRQVVGYTLGEGERSPYFGSLVLMNEDGTYSGNVGGGFNTEELEEWTKLLTSSPSRQKPFRNSEVGNEYIPIQTSVRVKVRYYEQTVNGALRFPVYVDIAD